MSPHTDSHHTLFFAAGAFVLLMLLGMQADVRQASLAAVNSPFSGGTVKTVLTLDQPLAISEWNVIGGQEAVSALSDTVCDGNATFIEPRYYATSEALFSVSLKSIPDGAHITSLSITPCIAAAGGVTESDVAVTYNFPDETYLFQKVAGKGSVYILKQGSPGAPAVQKPSVFPVPHLIKKPNTTLTVGLIPVRNGGGIRASQFVVEAEYIPPAVAGGTSVEKEPFAVKMESTIDTKGYLFMDAVLTWDAVVGAKGGEIEVMRIDESGQPIGTWSMIGMVAPGEGVFRYPLVTAGVPRDDYVSGARYVFRIRHANTGSNLVAYSDKKEVAPPTNLRILSPTAFSAKVNTNGKRVELSWTDRVEPSDFHWFIIERAVLANTLDWKEVGRTDPYETSWHDLGPFTPGNYFYRIRAVQPLSEHSDAFVISDLSEIQGVLLTETW